MAGVGEQPLILCARLELDFVPRGALHINGARALADTGHPRFLESDGFTWAALKTLLIALAEGKGSSYTNRQKVSVTAISWIQLNSLSISDESFDPQFSECWSLVMDVIHWMGWGHLPYIKPWVVNPLMSTPIEWVQITSAWVVQWCWPRLMDCDLDRLVRGRDGWDQAGGVP